MKKILILLCVSVFFSVYAEDKTTTTKEDEKTVEKVDVKKKASSTTAKRDVKDKWSNWSKIKDIFM